MDTIVYAIPVFFFLIALEWAVDLKRKTGTLRLNDAIASLSTGMLSITTGIASKLVRLGIYIWCFNNLSLLELPANHWLVWLIAFVAYDLCYYLLHRAGHRVHILWAAHAVHHQSQEYNLSTALRQTSSGFIFDWIFYLPLALLGVPPLVFLAVGSINLLYQFWVHTRHIGRLGILEKILVTPSNHRVHHAINFQAIDKNYGGVFIIWDRLLGTFVDEKTIHEPLNYGVKTPLNSFDPITANLRQYHSLWQTIKQANSWRNKLIAPLMPPAWGAEPKAADTVPAVYNPSCNRGIAVYASLQFVLLIGFTTALMAISHVAPLSLSMVLTVLLAWSLVSINGLLSGSAKAVSQEIGRLALVPILYATLVITGQLPMWGWLWIALGIHAGVSVFTLLQLAPGGKVQVQKS